MHGEVAETNHPIENVFVYELTAGLATYNDCALAFLEDLWPAYKALSTVHYHLKDLYVVNLDNLDDFGTVLVDETGSVDSESLPSYDTWGFSLTRVTRASQNGRKFIGLIAETDQQGGAPASGAVARILTMQTKLASTIQYAGDDAVFTPRIWRRPGTYVSGVVPAPGLFYPIGSAFLMKITTFRTRSDQ